MITEPFEQWGLDIIGEIKPNSSLQHKYILTATDYFTCWVEAVPLHKINEDEVISFLQEHIITKFGVPVSLVIDNAKYFSSIKLTAFSHDKGIKLHYFANYYPQGNGLAESSNKNLIRILKKTVVENQRSWHSSLPNSLWLIESPPSLRLECLHIPLSMVKRPSFLPISCCHLPL